MTDDKTEFVSIRIYCDNAFGAYITSLFTLHNLNRVSITLKYRFS